MSEIEVGMTASAGVVLTALAHWNNGRIDDAIALFAEEFRFNDHGIGLEFKEKERLAEFFCKNRELYPDAELQTDTIFLRGDRVVFWSSLFTAGSHAKFQSRCMGLPSCGRRTGRLGTGRTTTTD